MARSYSLTKADHAKARAIFDREPWPIPWEEEVERAREVVRAVGDLPSGIAYDMIMHAPPETNTTSIIDEPRGPDAPPYPPTSDPRV